MSTLFEQQGLANATSSALDQVLRQALESGAGAAGGAVPPTGAVLLPRLGRQDAPAHVLPDRLTGRGLVRAVAPDSPVLVVAARDRGWLAVQVPAEALALRRTEGMDPALGLASATLDLPLSDAGSAVAADWPAAARAGQVALAHELIGISRTMLRLAREHALGREQFGRPIASFQAIRHRLAEALVAVEAAQSVVTAAWDDPSPLAAALAKAVAGRCAGTVARHAQQVLAGMGYTTEHPFHRYLRRALLLDQLLGSSRAITRDVGAQLLATGHVPAMLAL